MIAASKCSAIFSRLVSLLYSALRAICVACVASLGGETQTDSV